MMAETTAEQYATDWIDYAQYDPNDVPKDVGILAQDLIGPDLSLKEPELTWAIIQKVVDSFRMEDLDSDSNTIAQKVIGRLAAGPIEDLLSHHGPAFIERVEAAAHRDQRMRWALGGVWRFEMTDEIWARVQAAAGENPYWTKRSF